MYGSQNGFYMWAEHLEKCVFPNSALQSLKVKIETMLVRPSSCSSAQIPPKVPPTLRSSVGLPRHKYHQGQCQSVIEPYPDTHNTYLRLPPAVNVCFLVTLNLVNSRRTRKWEGNDCLSVAGLQRPAQFIWVPLLHLRSQRVIVNRQPRKKTNVIVLFLLLSTPKKQRRFSLALVGLLD